MLGVLLAVLVYAPTSGQAGAYAERVRAALLRVIEARGEGSIDALALARQRAEAQWVPLAALDGFARAEHLVANARHAAERVELDAAHQAYVEAERIYEQNGASPLVEIPWAQAALEHGVVLFESGHVAEAHAAFARAHALDPSLILTERTVRPDVARAYAEIDASPAPGVLRVTVEPAPTALWIDGTAVPVSDGTWALARSVGLHRVVAARGRARVAAFVAARAGDSSITKLTLTDDPVTAALATLAQQPTAEGVRALAQLTGADGAVAVAIAVDAGNLTLVGARLDAHGCATARVTLWAGRAATISDEHLARAAHALLERLQNEPPVCGPGPALTDAEPVAHPRPAPPAIRPRPLYAQPWFWASCAAAAATAVVLGVTLAPIETSYRASISGSAFSH